MLDVRNRPLRYVYCKNGDVVAELDRIGPRPTGVPEVGPSHYTTVFLDRVAGSPVLLLSFHHRSAVSRKENVEARVFKLSYPALGYMGTIFAEIANFFRTCMYLLRFRPTHLLCAAHGLPLLACYLVSRLYRLPLTCSRHGCIDVPYATWPRRLVLGIERWVLRRANAVICHGPYLEKQLLDTGVDRKRILQFNLSYRHFLTVPTSQPEGPDLAKGGRYSIVFYAGRIERSKGPFDLLDAVVDRLQTDPCLRLVFAGDGTDLPALKEQATRISVNNQIYFLGHVQHNLLPAIMSQATVVVTPTQSSSTEARCKTAIEALMVGKPVIAPRFGPFPYIVKHCVNGMLYQPDSIIDLRTKIDNALNDHDLYSRLLEGARESNKPFATSDFTFREALDAALAGGTAGDARRGSCARP